MLDLSTAPNADAADVSDTKPAAEATTPRSICVLVCAASCWTRRSAALVFSAPELSATVRSSKRRSASAISPHPDRRGTRRRDPAHRRRVRPYPRSAADRATAHAHRPARRDTGTDHRRNARPGGSAGRHWVVRFLSADLAYVAGPGD